MRPIISYDDIATPQTPEPAVPPTHQTNGTSSVQPPAKKRKTGPNHRQGGSGNGRARQSMPHWDDPESQGMPMNYDDAPTPAATKAAALEEEEEDDEEEESRELTHEEIWDDSALIDAWNSAAAEYEAFHGPGKKWKQDAAKKSPLSWYNVPPAKPKASKGGLKASSSKASGSNAEDVSFKAEPADSSPLNFDTFVPTHDASLAAAAESSSSVPMMDGALGSGAEAAMVSQDDAFSRAMTAMYWTGYWTAVYHCRRNESQGAGVRDETDAAGAEGDEVEEGEDEDEDMLPAQR